MLVLLNMMAFMAQAQSVPKVSEKLVGRNTEVYLLTGYHAFCAPETSDYMMSNDSESSGVVFYSGVNRTFRSNHLRRVFGFSCGLAYRQFSYIGGGINANASSIVRFDGNFLESFGSLFVRNYSHHKKLYFTFALMPFVDLWGKYDEYISTYNHSNYSQQYPYGGVSSYIENHRRYFCDRISFRLNLSYNFQITEELGVQFALFPGLSSHIASLDACVGAGWVINNPKKDVQP